ncbi:serine hydrolase domain-containing protein [Streptomyces sp. NBC_01803]|uniref:serine hydrolase domain-containing protein n=1 Tax=Streptomyces sp. NBC_01803 TaxID=2975946 RepID=UPI002DDC4D21|nr:serine hydrolase domain-containing protein [Streptomyces sp. NBC_01803]WSA43584.1 beta-lactamase family protein [Streptomyces sp. NBC_01803]
MSEELRAELWTVMAELLDDPAIPGAVAVMVRGPDRAVLAAGRSARGVGAPAVGTDTPFALGSVTKTFTALLLAELAARGDVRYADPIESYLPAGAAPRRGGGPPITLLDLATHSGGLPHLPRNVYRRGLRHWLADPYARYRAEDLYRATARLRSRRRTARYSTFGMGLLGTLLANAAGTDYVTLVTERVLTPLGMRHTGVPGTAALAAAEPATGHRRGRPVPHWTLDALAGAGALYTTGADLLRYLLAHLAPERTPLAAALDAVRRPHQRYEDGDNDVCLAWTHRVVGSRALLWHTGGTGGFTAFAGFGPDAAAGAAVLANAGPTRAEPVLRAGRRLLRRAVFPDR